MPAVTRQHRDLRANFAFLGRLNTDGGGSACQIVAYVPLHDAIVGGRNTAPPGQVVRWVPRPVLGLSHIGATTEPRILADIARRLRNEPPWSTDPPEPLPAGR